MALLLCGVCGVLLLAAGVGRPDPAALPPDVPQGPYTLEHRTIRQPLDHADPTGPAFEQHIDILRPANAPPTAPVFLNYGNEAPTKPERLERLYRTYPRETDVIFIQAEHRGYGKSVSDDADQSRPAYVRTEQAHADMHTVIATLRHEFPGPWMMAGWSYGGGLVIDYAARYPDDVDAVLSSSGVVDWPFAMDVYDRQIRETLGAACYGRLSDHMDRLASAERFDEAWLEQEFLIAVTHGITQMGNLKGLQAPFRLLTRLPTGAFVRTMHWLDAAFGEGMAWNYARSNAKLRLTRDEKLTMDFDWRVWRYQQCVETGVFELNAGASGIMPRTVEDFCAECEALFGAGTCKSGGERWSPRAALSRVTVPLIYVSGARDPWDGLGIQPGEVFDGLTYFRTDDGQHCPERIDRDLAREVFAALLAAATPARPSGPDLVPTQNTASKEP